MALDLHRLKHFLSYDPATGIFVWLVSKGRSPAGSTAGRTRKDGYVIIGIDNKEYLAHRLAWFFVSETWPPEEVDHVNLNPSDNRIANLRLATRSQNQQNVPTTKANKSGLKGVMWDSSRKKWRAEICVERKRYYLGRFFTKSAARDAYVSACIKLHGEFARAA